jgi:predicted transcriptional regulator
MPPGRSRPALPVIGTFDTLEALDALADPFRIQVMEQFTAPTTVKLVARALDVPVTRLYYHVNLLLRHGFLRVDEERRVGGLIERTFVMTAEGFAPSESFLRRYGAEGRLEAMRLVLRTAEAGFEAAAAQGLLDVETTDIGTLSLGLIRLTPERGQEFVERLAGLLSDFEDDEEGESFWRLVAVLPRWAGTRG